MGIKSYRPTSPSRRFITGSDYAELTTDRPYYPLTERITEKLAAITPVK